MNPYCFLSNLKCCNNVHFIAILLQDGQNHHLSSKFPLILMLLNKRGPELLEMGEREFATKTEFCDSKHNTEKNTTK